MLGSIFVAIAWVALTRAQEGEVIVPDNKTVCINDMIKWCDSMQYPQQGVGMAVLSITYEDPSGYYQVFCSSDSDGTNCTRNRIQWFSCTPDHLLTYKGQNLSSNSSADVDDEICTTADKAFNEIFVQNLSYRNTTLKKEVQKGFEAFFEELAAMEEQIELIQKKLNSLPFFSSDYWGGLTDASAFMDTDSTTSIPSEDKQNSTELTNEIEVE